MADFTALKSAIQTYIKQNGNEEITGEKLQEILLSMVTTLGDSAINDLIIALNDEVAARQNADGTLQQNITNEATARGNADTALGGRIDDEATARANGDTALSDRLGSTITAENTAADQIGAEAEARAAADTALQVLIDGITGNIENGYVYAGIATPSSTPATGKVFYLALAAGTYTNFGNTEVSQGINILKYNGSAWSLDAFIGIDDELTPGSNKLPKSGNVLENIIKNGSAFDLSAYNAEGGVLATYADLDAALTALNALPAVYKQVGMSFRFVRTSDNKYVQYRLMSDTWSTTVSDWQGVDEEPTVGSNNLIKSGGVYEAIQRLSFIVWYNEFTDIPNEGGYINNYGTVSPFANTRYTDYISVTPGKTYFVKKPFIIDNARLAIYNANKNFIRSIDASALSDGNLTFIANENEYYIRVSFQLTGGFPKYISLQNERIIGWIDNDSVTTLKIKDDAVTTPKIKDGAVTIPKLSDSVKDIFSVANLITTDNTQSGYINDYGGISSFDGARATDYLLVKKGVPVVLLNPFVQDLASIALYDKTKTVTRIISYSEIGVNPEIAIVVPNENESYLRVSFSTTKIPNVIYYAMDKSTFPGSVFDAYNVIDGGYINNVGNVNEFPSGNFAYTDYIELPQGIQFKVVNKTIDLASFAIYNSDKSVSRVILSSDVSGQEYIDFTLSGDEKYIRTTLRTGDICNVYFNEIITKCDILKRIENTQVQTEKQYNVLAAFDNIVCVGDSLTFSQVYTAQSVSRQANRPYPTVLGKLCGNDTSILARAGATAQMCWNEFGSQIVAKTNPLAIIYLGTNYGLTDTLDTDVVGNDPDNWADNNIGCYCRFVQKFQSLGYKVLLLKCWATSGTGTADLANTNSSIQHIGERFGCSVMDVPVSPDLKYHYYPDLSGYNGVHYNDLGYSWFASALISAASNLETDEMKFIIPNP